MHVEEYTEEELEEQYYEYLLTEEQDIQRAVDDYAMEHEEEALDCDY